MSLVASRNSQIPTPIGTYAARCIDALDAGWWKNLNGEFVRKVKLVFYLGKDKDTGRDLYVDAFETLSLGKKANLTKLMTAWRGRDFTADELKGFDLEKCVTKTAFIQVQHKQKQDGSIRSIIGSIMPLPDGMTAPDAPEKYVRDKDREEPMAEKFPPPGKSAAEEAAASTDEDDDLPF